MGSQILAFQCDRVLTYIIEFNACDNKSILTFFDVCLLMMGSECVWFLGRRSNLTQTFVENCVDFEVAHLYIWFGDCHTGDSCLK